MDCVFANFQFLYIQDCPKIVYYKLKLSDEKEKKLKSHRHKFYFTIPLGCTYFQFGALFIESTMLESILNFSPYLKKKNQSFLDKYSR